MKYLNMAIFLLLLAFVTGCQKKYQNVSTKKEKNIKVARRGPTKLQTKSFHKTN